MNNDRPNKWWVTRDESEKGGERVSLSLSPGHSNYWEARARFAEMFLRVIATSYAKNPESLRFDIGHIVDVWENGIDPEPWLLEIIDDEVAMD